MRNVSEKNCMKDPDIYLKFHNPPLPPSENRAVYEMMWENMVESYRSHMTIYLIGRMGLAYWINKATEAHS